MASGQNERAFYDSLGNSFNNLLDSPGSALAGLLLLASVLLILVYYFLIPKKNRLKFLWYYWWKTLRGIPKAASERIETHQMDVSIQRPGEGPRSGRILNINQSGFFVKLAPPLKVRDLFAFSFELERNTRVSATAIVLRVQPRVTAGTPVGMGCRFIDLSADQKTAIAHFLKTHS
ncbi:MAG: PilZ domain-containing protein [Spirochaetia bacterium]|nr:PilZ domain-containing protein [Spirochaetia bacterium]